MYQNLSAHHDWPVKKATVNFPIRMKANSKHISGPRGPFLESSGDFLGPKSNIQIEIKRIRARVLARNLLHFVSLTNSFFVLDAKLLKPLSCM